MFGWGAIQHLGPLCNRRGWKRVLVVTDPCLVEAGALAAAEESLHSSGCQSLVFTDGEAEPSLECGERAIAFARDCQPDAILGLGGGSNMDLAKMTAIGAAHGPNLRRFFGEDSVPGPVTPILCAPTTAGTGSEVSGSCVLTDRSAAVKVGVTSNYLRPALSLVDPALTMSCPRKVTADSGIDALTHAIEAYTAVDNEDFPLPPGVVTIYQGRHPLGQSLAAQAIQLIGASLVRVVEHLDDRKAREDMALAALLAGLAFSNIGVALVHAMEYPVGGAVHCSHGEGNGLLLPHVMRFNLPVRKSEFRQIAKWLGRETDTMDEERGAEEAVLAVEEIQRKIGVRSRLRELGLPLESLDEMATKAYAVQRLLRVNARQPSQSEILQIFQQAY